MSLHVVGGLHAAILAGIRVDGPIGEACKNVLTRLVVNCDGNVRTLALVLDVSERQVNRLLAEWRKAAA